jgi:hypothetical protein
MAEQSFFTGADRGELRLRFDERRLVRAASPGRPPELHLIIFPEAYRANLVAAWLLAEAEVAAAGAWEGSVHQDQPDHLAATCGRFGPGSLTVQDLAQGQVRPLAPDLRASAPEAFLHTFGALSVGRAAGLAELLLGSVPVGPVDQALAERDVLAGTLVVRPVGIPAIFGIAQCLLLLR